MQDYIPREIDINEKIETVTVKQYDHLSRFLRIQIFDKDLDENGDRQPLNIVGCNARLYMETDDNLAFIDGKVTDGEMGITTFSIPNGATQKAGNYRAEIVISDPTGNFPTISTKEFVINVEQSVRVPGKIEATGQFSALENALNNVDSFRGEMNTINSRIDEIIALLLCDGAGAHNAVYRGKNLGTSVTSAQYQAISSGKFTDLYIGDYWVIDSVNWRIAAFDYYNKTGDTPCDTHHITLVPDTALYNAQMHKTESGQYEPGAANNTTEGAYVNSDMYKTGLAEAKSKIETAFGAAHILQHRQYLANATADGRQSAASWYDSTVELMTENNVYGGNIFHPVSDGKDVPTNHTIDKSQYPLFAMRPDMISNRTTYWLRDVVSAAYFAAVYSNGRAYYTNASYPLGVRPAFSIKS